MQGDKPIISRGVDAWTSKRAPGTPAFIEALFILKEKGLSNSAAYRTNLSYLRSSESELDLWFVEWLNGKVHPDLQQKKKDLLKPWMEALAERSL